MGSIKIRKLCYGGLFIALAVLLPLVFHFFAGPLGGKFFLPMHLPILLGGFVLGWKYGLILGLVAPLISSLLTGMPDPTKLPFMMIELGAYGFAAGVLYYMLNLRKKKLLGIYLSLVGAMIFGRFIYILASFFAICFLRIVDGQFFAIIGSLVEAITLMMTSVVNGLYGIILQIVLIPGIVYALERSGFLERYNNSKTLS